MIKEYKSTSKQTNAYQPVVPMESSLEGDYSDSEGEENGSKYENDHEEEVRKGRRITFFLFSCPDL